MRSAIQMFLATLALVLSSHHATGMALGGSEKTKSQGHPSVEQAWVETHLARAVAEHGVPAAAAVVVLPDGKTVEAVAGVRRAGDGVSATVDDLWHVGSLTKSITGSVAARLSELGLLSLDATVADVFPAESTNWTVRTRSVTARHLLTMSSGLSDDLVTEERIVRWLDVPGDSRERRRGAALDLLAEGVSEVPGEAFEYANSSYVVVGAIMEELLDLGWEEIVAKHFLAPLGIEEDGAGFGAPGSKAPLTQPWGHTTDDDGLKPVEPSDLKADNPSVLAPAGTMHFRLRDWARFARDHLEGEAGRGRLMSSASYQAAHQPLLGVPGYSFGWGVRETPDGDRLLVHTGSNNLWFSVARLSLAQNVGFLVVTNVAGDPAVAALRDLTAALEERYLMTK